MRLHPFSAIVLGALLGSAVACGTAAQPQEGLSASPGGDAEPRRGGVMVLAQRGDPPSAWDYMRTNTNDLPHMANAMFGTTNLIKSCREDVYKICPNLAESWQASSDFTQWTFKVRDGVTWHDGTRFSPEDVKFWMELAFSGASVQGKNRLPAINKANLGDLKSVEVLDGNRVRVTLGRPTVTYLDILNEPRVVPAHPKHLMEQRIAQGDVNVGPQDVGWIGTGPFKMQSYEKGVGGRLRRYDGYWEKDPQGRQLPFLEGIDFAIVRDPSAMDAAFRVGRLDGGARGVPYYMTPERKEAYVRDLGDKVWFAEIGNPASMFDFNVINPGPLQDLRVRKAIALWLDKQASMLALHGGFAYLATYLDPRNPFTSPDFKSWPGFNPDPAARQADRTEARRLLTEAGYPNGFKISFLIPQRWASYGEFFHEQLRGLGIELELKILDEAAYNGARLTKDYDTQYGGISGGGLIPEAGEVDLTTFTISKGNAAIKHEDQKIADFFARLNRATKLEERVETWRALERYIIVEQVYAVPMSGSFNVVPYRSHVKGQPIPPERILEYLDFATAWLDK